MAADKDISVPGTPRAGDFSYPWDQMLSRCSENLFPGCSGEVGSYQLCNLGSASVSPSVEWSY